MKKYFQMTKQFLEVNDLKKPLRFLFPYIIRYKNMYIALLFFILIDIFITLLFAWFLKHITDIALEGEFHRILSMFAIGILIIIITNVSDYYNTFLESLISSNIKKDIKNDLYQHVLRIPAIYFQKHHSGELVSKFTNDIESIHNAVGGSLLNLISLPLFALSTFIYLVTINWRLSLLCLMLVPIAILSGAIFGKKLRKNNQIIHEHFDKVYSFLNDSFSGQLIIRSFTMERLLVTKYTQQSNELLALERKDAKIRAWFHAGAGAAGSMAFFLSLGIGAFFVANDSLSVGSLVAFVSLMQYMINPLTSLAENWGGFQRSISAVERIADVFNEQVETLVLPSPIHTQSLKDAIRIQNLSFAYDNQKIVLKDLNLTIPKGSVVALVGPSGAGKSTLMNLIQGIYNPISGIITIDNRMLEEFSLSELRSFFAYVPQESYLFSGTIRDNLLNGNPNAKENIMIKAATDANIHDFILSLPEGYDTHIGERGILLSGGQKQRLTIARALIKDAPILLLDEATSSLDSDSESFVQEALERLMSGRTTIVIAHRMSTIQNADVIIAMDEGKVVEVGSHNELKRKNGLYNRLYAKQFGKQDSSISIGI